MDPRARLPPLRQNHSVALRTGHRRENVGLQADLPDLEVTFRTHYAGCLPADEEHVLLSGVLERHVETSSFTEKELLLG